MPRTVKTLSWVYTSLSYSSNSEFNAYGWSVYQWSKHFTFKTFGGSLTQPTKSPFISQAALTSRGANIIHNIHYIQRFDKLVLGQNTARHAPWWELDWNSESSILNDPCEQINGCGGRGIWLLVMQVIDDTDCVLFIWNENDWNISVCPSAFLPIVELGIDTLVMW